MYLCNLKSIFSKNISSLCFNDSWLLTVVYPFISNETLLKKQLQGQAYFIEMTWKWLKSQYWRSPIACPVQLVEKGWRPDMPWSYLFTTCSRKGIRSLKMAYSHSIKKNDTKQSCYSGPINICDCVFGKQPCYCSWEPYTKGIVLPK